MRRIGLMQEVTTADSVWPVATAEASMSGPSRASAMQLGNQAPRRQWSWLDVYYAEIAVLAFFDQTGSSARDAPLDRAIADCRPGSAQPGRLATLPGHQEALALADRRDELNRDVAVARANACRLAGIGTRPIAFAKKGGEMVSPI